MECVEKKPIGIAEKNEPVVKQTKVPDRTIKAEANLLRLPLFALHTKGLKSLDGIECRGQITRDSKTQTYVLRVSRNTASLYPGTLSRKIHFAFLSIATE